MSIKQQTLYDTIVIGREIPALLAGVIRMLRGQSVLHIDMIQNQEHSILGNLRLPKTLCPDSVNPAQLQESFVFQTKAKKESSSIYQLLYESPKPLALPIKPSMSSWAYVHNDMHKICIFSQQSEREREWRRCLGDQYRDVESYCVHRSLYFELYRLEIQNLLIQEPILKRWHRQRKWKHVLQNHRAQKNAFSFTLRSSLFSQEHQMDSTQDQKYSLDSKLDLGFNFGMWNSSIEGCDIREEVQTKLLAYFNNCQINIAENSSVYIARQDKKLLQVSCGGKNPDFTSQIYNTTTVIDGRLEGHETHPTERKKATSVLRTSRYLLSKEIRPHIVPPHVLWDVNNETIWLSWCMVQDFVFVTVTSRQMENIEEKHAHVLHTLIPFSSGYVLHHDIQHGENIDDRWIPQRRLKKHNGLWGEPVFKNNGVLRGSRSVVPGLGMAGECELGKQMGLLE